MSIIKINNILDIVSKAEVIDNSKSIAINNINNLTKNNDISGLLKNDYNNNI
jgi:hypothetical protein